MDAADMGECPFSAGDAKLHGELCGKLSTVVSKVVGIFPIIEDARPGSKSGIQALCSLHVVLDKAKNLLSHCANCSKLYLAITGDSVLLKFEKARSALQESLRRVENIVPDSIGCQIIEIVGELDEITFVLDQSEKQAGDDVIRLLQKEKKFDENLNEIEEIEIFHQAATRLGINSSRAALTERRALKKLIERARHEEDKRKESIVAYLLHLMRKYSKLFRNELTDETDSQGSTPCSPTVSSSFGEGYGPRNPLCFDRQLSRLSSFCFKPSSATSSSMPAPPEELRCPISLQIMYDPVIISSGQTYERLCIEKWFNDGHRTCPKTHQQLSHLCLTPNYCAKALITSWCEQNGVSVPEGPPDSLDLNYWRLALSEGDGSDSRSGGSVDSYKVKDFGISPCEGETGVTEIFEGMYARSAENVSRDCEVDDFQRCNKLLPMLYADVNINKLQKVVEQIRLILKDDEEARVYMGSNCFIEALVRFLRLSIEEGDEKAQNIGAMALFNLAVNNDRNKEMMLSSGLVPLLEEMMSNSAFESATAMYLNLSSLAEAKAVIGSSTVVFSLVELLKTDECSSQCKADALQTMYNLTSHPPSIPSLLSSGILDALQTLIDGSSGPADTAWVEKSMAILIKLASSKPGKKEIVSTPGLVSSIAAVLDTGEPSEQEQALSCLLILCNGDQRCSHMVLQEGVIPALVSLSVNGTQHGKEKAHKLLMLFREQRQREPSSLLQLQQQPPTKVQAEGNAGCSRVTTDTKPLCKSASKRVGRTLSCIWKSKHFSVYQC